MKKNLYPRTRIAYSVVLIFLVASFISFFACNKNSSTDTSTTSNPNNIPAEQTVTASLQGRVLDEKGLPVQNAAVVSGTHTTTTDVNGIFSFTSISMSSRFGFVKVSKTGYFTGSRSIITNGGAANFVSIQLMPRTSKGSFPAATGGTIAVEAGDSAAFPTAAVVTASTNATYTGNVHVFASYLDPTAADLYKYMPGDLRGIGTDGKETGLQSFGMLAVELEGDAGEKLQLAAGKKATLTWAIPSSLQAMAPATIPLWYFNDSTGRWIQEGMAIRVGGTYVGQVGHFSYWNCDAPAGTVNFKIHVKDQHGNPLAYTYIQFQSDSYGTRGGYTDSSGFAQGMIPKGQTLVMQVVSECGNVLAGKNVGPALTDQDLGTIVATLDLADIVVKGTVVDCSLNPVDSGFVAVHIDGLNYNAAVIKGAFTLPITRCFSYSTTAQLTAGDFKTAQQSDAVSVSATTGTVDAGQLTACGVSIDQFIKFTVDGSTYNILTPTDNISEYVYGTTTSIYGSTAGQTTSLSMQFSNFSATTSSIDSLYVNTSTNFYGGAGVSCTISSFGPVNGYILGSFSGTTNGAVGKPISGSFKVKRTN